jgi:hypothetical protein
MQNKPIFIGFAAAIVILIVAAASFSAGLYLGQRGYVADLEYRSLNSGLPAGNPPRSGPQAGQPNPGGINPDGGPPGAPSWPPDLIGRLVSLTATELTLDTPKGQVTVSIDSSTKFIDEAGNTMSSADLKMGEVVAVFGKEVAVTIMRLPPRPNAP